jgi:hypothetical protein
MPKRFIIIMVFALVSCSQTTTTKSEIEGKWVNEQGAFLVFDKTEKVMGRNIPHRLFSQLNEIESTNFDFGGEWYLQNEEIQLLLEKSGNIPLSYGCPLYVRRKGILENQGIEYLYLLEDIESEVPFKFTKSEK